MTVSAIPRFIGALAALALSICGAAALRAEPTAQIRILLRTALSGDATREVVVVSAEFPSGAKTGLHTHPGDEYATVLEGSLDVLVEGQPPKRVQAGEAYHNARGVIHETRNTGETAARIVATFVIDKGQPLSQPVPASSAAGPD